MQKQVGAIGREKRTGFLAQTILVFDGDDAEATLRGKLKRMEQRDDMKPENTNFLMIFTKEPEVLTRLFQEIAREERFAIDHPRLAHLIKNERLLIMCIGNKFICEMINERALLKEMTESGQITEAEAEQTFAEAVTMIKARYVAQKSAEDQHQASVSRSPRNALADENSPVLDLTSLMAADMLEDLGCSVSKFSDPPTKQPEDASDNCTWEYLDEEAPRPQKGSIYGKSCLVHTLPLYTHVSYEEVIQDKFSKLESREDLDAYHYQLLMLLTCDPHVVTGLVEKMTTHEGFANHYPKLAGLKKQHRLLVVPANDKKLSRRIFRYSAELERLAKQETHSEADPRGEAPHCQQASDHLSSGTSPCLASDSAPASSCTSESTSLALPSSNSLSSFGRRCASCGVCSTKLLLCSGCKAKWYCSPEHQKKDWRHHRPQCKKAASTSK